METRNRNFIVFAIFFAFMLLEPVSAFNLGTLQKSAVQDTSPGNTVMFAILFWNTGDYGYDVELENIEVPGNWTVISNPDSFYLNSTPVGNIEHIYLPSLKKTIEASLIHIYVSVPEYEIPGKKTVIIKAVAGSPGNVSGFSLKQERLFFFDIDVVKGLYQDMPNIHMDPKTVSVDINPKIVREFIDAQPAGRSDIIISPETIKTAFVIFGLALIIILAWRIYRYG